MICSFTSGVVVNFMLVTQNICYFFIIVMAWKENNMAVNDPCLRMHPLMWTIYNHNMLNYFCSVKLPVLFLTQPMYVMTILVPA